HHAEAFAFVDTEVRILHGMHFTVRRPEPHIEVLYFEDRCRRHQRSLGSRASRSPSPMKLKQNKVTAMNSAGKISIHGAVSSWFAPSEISTPHDVSGSRMPRPRNDRKLSDRITDGIVSVT